MSAIPTPLVPDPAAWKGADFSNPSRYTLTLDAGEQAQLRTAVAAIEAGGRLVPAHALTKADFPLGTLGGRLARAFQEVRAGRGFVLIRGIPTDGDSLEKFTAAVWGIGTCFGFPLSQNAQGELVGHVVDATGDDPTPRMYRSKFELGLHNDVTAMIALACWNPARRGGTSVFASAVTVHGEIRKRAPHLLEHLYRGFHYHRLGEEGPDEAPVTPYRIPVFAVRSGRVSCRNARAGYIAGHLELGIPISEEEVAAIDLFDEIAREAENHVYMDLRRGDMVLINNYTVLHARTGFDDAVDPGLKRHLLRLWLDAEGFRDVPKSFNQFRTNGIPHQPGRRCNYDFKALFERAPPALLGRRPGRETLGEIVSRSRA